MSIKYAILGFLSWKPATGYELKKIFEESSSMYWSGNNNQIYRTLLQIQDEGYVTSEVVHQDSLPSKKVYTITEEGQRELKEWIMSTPEAPEFKKPFLIQLAWSDLLNDQELAELLTKYAHELKMQLVIHEEKARRALNFPQRSTREVLLWDMISKNITSSYKNEMDWVQEVRQKLAQNSVSEERNELNYEIAEKENTKYIELVSAVNPLVTENDALSLIALCGEHDTVLLMIHHAALAEDFFRLKTGVAGKILQKLNNYNLKTAFIVPSEITKKGKFKDLAAEARDSHHFRIFESREEALAWLL